MKATFRPLLAAAVETEADYDKLVYPLLASPKIDGIRVICHPTMGAITRSCKPVPNKSIREILSQSQFRWLDGEITVGPTTAPDVFNRTQSAVMSHDGTPTFTYTAFDTLDQLSVNCPFTTRLDDARTIVERYQNNFDQMTLSMLEHEMIYERDHLDAYEEAMVAASYEGIMLRRPDGRYKMNRSTLNEGILLKLKRFVDDEAVICGYEPLQRNENEAFEDERGFTKRSSANAGKAVDYTRIGKFNVIATTGRFKDVAFKIGSGLTDSQRLQFAAEWPKMLGATITFKYQDHGSKDAPRAPIFKGVRYPE